MNMKLTKSIVNTRILLYMGIFVLVNLLISSFYFRLDFTEDQRYTLSQGTKDLLENLNQQVTVSAYFSDELPPQLNLIKSDLQDMLAEYESKANGMLVYEFITPEDDAEKEKILQSGLPQVQVNVRESDKFSSKAIFMGAQIKMGDKVETIPQVGRMGIEYELSTGIKKLSLGDQKIKVGWVVGHGEAGMNKLQNAQQFLDVQYQIDTITLDQPDIWTNYKLLVILKPMETLPPEHLAQLDAFLNSGGGLFIGLDAVKVDLNQQGPWDRLNTGLETWLNNKGVMVEQTFLIDQQCNRITVTVGMVNTPFGRLPQQEERSFPFLPLINNFSEHPITSGLEQMTVLFPSPITLTNVDSTVRSGNLFTSSAQSGKLPAPTFFNPQRAWTEQDFANGQQSMAVWLEGSFGGGEEAKMIVIGDGDFPTDHQWLTIDNVNLLVNSLDWLADDTGLVALRNKAVSTRPFDEQLEDGTRTLIKTLNFLLPILIVIGFGIIRWQRRRSKQLKWEAQDFS